MISDASQTQSISLKVSSSSIMCKKADKFCHTFKYFPKFIDLSFSVQEIKGFVKLSFASSS